MDRGLRDRLPAVGGPKLENPLRSEASAFRLVLVTLAAFAVIAVVGLLWGGWAAFVAWVVVTAAAVGYYATRRRAGGREAPARVPHVGPADEARVLVVVDETIDGDELAAHVLANLGGRRARVLVVAPALTSHGHRWLDDSDADRASAQERLDTTLAQLAAAGVAVEGQVGSPEPLEAVTDAVGVFGADRIVVVTHPRADENWAERGFVARLRERLDVPVDQVVAG